MKGLNVFITIFLTALTVFCGIVLAFSFSSTNQIINGFYSNLDEKGFWLNPGNSNISTLEEYDTYKGNVTYLAQNSDLQMNLGITQPNNGYFEINVNRKYQSNSIFKVKTIDSTTGQIEQNPATIQDFLDTLGNISQNSTTQKMDICVSKSIEKSGNTYDHFCGILIYED